MTAEHTSERAPLDEECIHGLGLTAACVICNGRAADEAKVPDETPVITVTRYLDRYAHALPGFQAMCPECGLPIYPGQTIAWFKEHSQPTVHVECLGVK